MACDDRKRPGREHRLARDARVQGLDDVRGLLVCVDLEHLEHLEHLDGAVDVADGAEDG